MIQFAAYAEVQACGRTLQKHTEGVQNIMKTNWSIFENSRDFAQMDLICCHLTECCEALL